MRWALRPRYQQTWFYVICVIIIYVGIIGEYHTIQREKTVESIAISSVTYFNHSKFYQSHTAAILFKARQQLRLGQRWFCVSKNSTNRLVTKTAPRSAFRAVQTCSLHVFIATCRTVENPTSFSLMLSRTSEDNRVPLPIRSAVQERLPVVSCVSSLFMAERWQVVILSIESYAHFGVNRQAYYFLSGMESILDLLKAYEKTRLIDLHYWAIPDLDEINAKLSLSTRDQAGALNDCYVKYREAADFIIVHDVDDIIIPRHRPSFFSEFAHLWRIRPETSYFNFPSYNTLIETKQTLNNFSLEKTLQSISIKDQPSHGKCVYNTSLVETVWLHWAYFFDEAHYTPHFLNVDDGILLHARNWTIESDKTDVKRVLPNFLNITTLATEEDIQIISKNFLTRLLEFKKVLPNLTSTNHYYRIIDTCVKKIGGPEYPVYGCRTHYACPIPRMTGVRCADTRQAYLKYNVDNQYFVYVPSSSVSTVINFDGCRV